MVFHRSLNIERTGCRSFSARTIILPEAFRAPGSSGVKLAESPPLGGERPSEADLYRLPALFSLMRVNSKRTESSPLPEADSSPVSTRNPISLTSFLRISFVKV